ncbi:hypothetical protein [Amnibacterium endophyticum]|uniref:Uncharacterized protein n=1 Tax=Amnibacterium endophyticum TaxID=2109337 RepID=A0ABW4LF28_9MICO
MPGRPPALGTALLLGGVLVLFVSVIAQLATTDGLAQTLWVGASIAGAVLAAIGIAVLIRRGTGGGGAPD